MFYLVVLSVYTIIVVAALSLGAIAPSPPSNHLYGIHLFVHSLSPMPPPSIFNNSTNMTRLLLLLTLNYVVNLSPPLLAMICQRACENGSLPHPLRCDNVLSSLHTTLLSCGYGTPY